MEEGEVYVETTGGVPHIRLMRMENTMEMIINTSG